KGEVWVISNIGVIKRDTLAKYEGRYGFLFDKSFSGDGVSAQHSHNFTTCAVDVYWNITDYRGLAYSQPEGAIALTGNVSDGSLGYFNNNGRPEFSWYRGSYRFLQTGTWNRWYPVTIIWNGSNTKVIIDGTEYAVSAAATNSSRVYLRVNKITREYFDLVRVRKYSSPEPGVAFGPAESSNHPPVLTLQDTAFSLCEPETTSFNLSATDPDSANILTLEKLFGPGDFTPLTGSSPLNTTHSFFPAPLDSTYLFVFRVTDSKGAFTQESSYVHIHLNQSPILTLPEDIDTVLCNLGDSLYLTVRGEDPDITDTLTLEKISSQGELLPTNPVSGTSPRLANFLWKPEYSDTVDNPNPIIFKLKDLCGKEVQDTLFISVRFNHLPILTLPADTIYDLCQLDTICFNQIFAIDSDSNDSVFIQKLSGPGEYNPGTGICCFLPSSKDSTYTFIFKAQDLCGASTLDTFNLTVNLNQSPVLFLPVDTSYKLCAPGDSILFEISASDPGDSLNLTKFSVEGELRPQNPITGKDSVIGTFVWKPVYSDTLSNPYLLIFQAIDNCGLSHTDTVQIRIEFNHLPVLVSQNSSYSLCNDSIICFNNLVGSDSDPDDSLSMELVSGPSCLFLTTVLNPTLITGFTCFQTTGNDTVYTFIFELKDKCGAKAVDTVYIEITPPANLLRGDPNGDAFVTVSDVIYIINYLFKSGPPPTNCPKSGDVNCDSKITVSDVVYLIGYLFKGGPPPCP
ncbi:MAG: dockerin type I repeat-containing protein, partial [candidate division Zixibacteria bacterium]|nr:dockerin type I repeat-containing protein [candidate division Zixibacteria bacterium]